MRALLALLCLVAATLAAAAEGDGTNFPNRPVKIVVPFPAGGPTDVNMRILGQKLSELWGQGVVIENRPGANTGIGQAIAVALAEATFGYGCGAEIELPETDLSLAAQLFSESHSRFVATVAPEDVVAFESILEGRATRLGIVTADGKLTVRHAGHTVIDADSPALRHAWTNGPVNHLLGVQVINN